MKNRVLVVILCCVCALLVGCEQADGLENVREDLRMSVVASIGDSDDFQYGRNASTDTPGKTTFNSGDAIGMMVGQGGNFVKWNYNGEVWTPEGNTIYWTNRETKYNFYAFWPYVENASFTDLPMPKLTSQNGTMDWVSQNDFLVAKTNQNYGDDGTVEFTGDNAFSHVYSMVVLTIKGVGDLASAALDKISLSGANLVTASSYSFQDNSVHLSDTKADELSVTLSNSMMGSGDKTFYFLLNAETVSLSAVTLSVHYTVDGVKYKAVKTGINKNVGDKFLGGYQYAYNISVVDNTLKISGESIKPWESGTSLGNITIEGKKEGTQS